MRAFQFVGVIAALASPIAARGQEMKVGDLVIAQPWARATPNSAPVGAAYVTIRNTGGAADRLIGGTTDAAGEVQVHEMTMDGDVMKMRQLPDGLEIPPGGSVELKPNSYHFMLMKLKKPLAMGQILHMTLTFARAGKASVDFPIGGIGDNGPTPAGGMKMDGGMNMKM